jgi:anti-anti-sigma regulatory factor
VSATVVSAAVTAEAPAPQDAPDAVRTIVHNHSSLEPTLLRALADARIGWQSHVRVDLGDTPMVSAAVLAALRRLGSCLRERGGELTVRSSHTGFVRLLELTLLTLSFELEKTAGSHP